LRHLDDAERAIKPRVASYLDRLERERRAIEERVRREEEARKAREEEALREAQKLRREGAVSGALDKLDEIEEDDEETREIVPDAPVMQGVHRRQVWKHRIVDFKKIPHTFLKLDNIALNDYMRNHAEELARNLIPGIEFYQETVIATRTK